MGEAAAGCSARTGLHDNLQVQVLAMALVVCAIGRGTGFVGAFCPIVVRVGSIAGVDLKFQGASRQLVASVKLVCICCTKLRPCSLVAVPFVAPCPIPLCLKAMNPTLSIC